MEKDLNFDDYIEVSEGGRAIGFRLEGDDFLYRYDRHGGWYDAKGNYYNKDAEKCHPPESSEESDEEDFPEDKVADVNLQKNTQRQETIRSLVELIDSYPEGKTIDIKIESEGLSDEQLTQFINDRKIHGKVLDAIISVDKSMAVSVAELEGYKVGGCTIYCYIDLYDSDVVKVVTPDKTEKYLVSRLYNLDFESGKDFANVQAESDYFVMDVARSRRKALEEAFPNLKIYTL